MDIKAIVLDIDGTLVNSNKEITPDTRNSLIQAQEKGIKIILASGRPTSGMWRYAEELRMEEYGGYIVSFNGACVTDCKTKEVLFSQTMSTETSQAILEHLKQFNLIPMVGYKGYLHVNNVYNGILELEKGPYNIIEYEARGGNYLLCEHEDLASFVQIPLYKILIAGQPKYIQELEKEMMAPFGERVTGVYSADFYFEFTDRGIDKAKALHTVFTPMNILSENMISFGDGHNDKSIIEYAGVGVAMGNAVDELKEIADAVTTTNDGDGIALYLQEFFQ